MIYLITLLVIVAMMIIPGAVIYSKILNKFSHSSVILSGFSAGLLMTIVFVGIIPEASEVLLQCFDELFSWIVLIASMVCGVLIILVLERINPVKHHCDMEIGKINCKSGSEVLFIIYAAFGIHSIFEFLGLLITGMSDLKTGVFLGVILAVHNIPIGFIMMAQLKKFIQSKTKIYIQLFVFALIEVAIALMVYALLHSVITPIVEGILIAITSGMMLYMCFDELFPSAFSGENKHVVTYSILAGIIIMFCGIKLLG